MVIQEVVSFLSRCVYYAVEIASAVFSVTDTWNLVYASIAVVLICRFILGPILGIVSFGAASDTVKTLKRARDISFSKSSNSNRGKNNG